MDTQVSKNADITSTTTPKGQAKKGDQGKEKRSEAGRDWNGEVDEMEKA